MSPRFRALFAIVLLLAILSQAQFTFACGPFSLDAVFAFTVHPEYPLEKFAAGNIGVVQSSYARSYLYVAYRYFNGEAFDQTQQQALLELWHDRLDLRWEAGDEQAIKTWQTARQKVSGVADAPKLDAFRNREKPNDYESYLNCQNDAFENAAATLTARVARFGADSAAMKQWVEAQDLVFANCSEGQHLPAELPADADALLRADRQYQIAAANFYSGNFANAKSIFESIAGDSKSPWRDTAPYLIARTSLRKASLGPEETKKESLQEAEQQLSKVVTDSKLKSSLPAALRLQNIVQLRLHPEARLHELALSLAGRAPSANLKQDLWDYTILLDQFIGDSEAHHQETKTPPAVLHEDDMTDWIVTLQAHDVAARDHALKRWEATSSMPWLIAALSKIDPHDAKATELLRAAVKVPPSSAAFPSVAFESIRLQIAAGRTGEARTKLDDLLRSHQASLNVTALNLFHHERMLTSSNLEEFLTYAQRKPAGFTWNEDGREIPAEGDEIPTESQPLKDQTHFDGDASQIFNRQMPLSLLREAAVNKTLPDYLRRDVTQATWLRAVLLGDQTTATALVPTLKGLVPELSPLLTEYTNAPDPAVKKFSAIYAWLKFPGLEPVVDSGSGRGTPLNEQDSYRDNWWCSAATSEPETADTAAAKPLTAKDETTLSFLTADQSAAATKEYTALTAIGTAPNYLCRQVVDWATKHPGDPRVPEALHLAVKSTRYGCTDKQTGRWSKAAYDFLRAHYPGNVWTKQTPYWYKD